MQIQNTFEFLNLIMKFDKMGAQHKDQNTNDLSKPIYYVSGIKRFEIGINPTKSLFSIEVSCKFLVFINLINI